MTGAPTLFVFDEGHLYLLHDVLLRGIDDYIRGLRKLNGAVIFATQSIADAARSQLAPIISDSLDDADLSGQLSCPGGRTPRRSIRAGA